MNIASDAHVYNVDEKFLTVQQPLQLPFDRALKFLTEGYPPPKMVGPFYGLVCPESGHYISFRTYVIWNDIEKISMAPAQGRHHEYRVRLLQLLTDTFWHPVSYGPSSQESLSPVLKRKKREAYVMVS